MIRRAVLGGSIFLTLLCASVTAPSQSAGPSPADLVVSFRDRHIDLGAHFEGFPYLRFRASYDAGQLLYFRDGRTARELWTLPLQNGAMVLDHGVRLGDSDWNQRNLRTARYQAPGHQYIVLADDANEERFNLFALPTDGAPMRRLTDKPYVYGFGLDRTGQQLAYVVRYGTGQPYHSCLNAFDLATGTEREVVCDTPELTFTWTDVVFSPDGQTVILDVLRASDRNHENLVAIGIHDPAPVVRLLTDPSQRRRNVGVSRDWFDDTHFSYTSDEDGFTNAYLYDLPARHGHAITHFREDVTDLSPFVVGERTVYGAIVRRPYESELFVVDPGDGAVLARRVFDATSTFLDNAGDHALLENESRRSRFELEEITIELPEPGRATIAVSPRASVPPAIAERIEQCNVERIRIPTFDIDPHTGTTRMLHAYLQTPRHPPARADRRFAFVEGFYGGDNQFDTTAEILCEAGGVVLSPSIRGSSGFGADFAALNDHDLGGNEVVDLIYAARYLTERFHLRPHQIGLFGGSHGGYEVMRAMTFPRGVNGRDDHFDWGFGVSWFGFSNILTFYEMCNIPDWVLLEAGDPVRDRDRLLDRSPVTHAGLATGPMLLLHGENDRRVPVRESRQMADALRAAHRPVVYVEFVGQGHGLKGLANQRRVWTEIFSFLTPVLARNDGPSIVAPRHTRRHAVLVGSLAALLAIAFLVLGARAGRN